MSDDDSAKIIGFGRSHEVRKVQLDRALETLATPAPAPAYSGLPRDEAGVALVEQLLADLKSGKVAGVTLMAWHRDEEQFLRCLSIPPEEAPKCDLYALRALGANIILKEMLLDLSQCRPSPRLDEIADGISDEGIDA